MTWSEPLSGPCLDLGRYKISVEDLRKITESKNRCRAGESVPAKGFISYTGRIPGFSRMTFWIAWLVSPYFSMSSAGWPDSPKQSGIPTKWTGTGQFSDTTSATEPPKPPVTWCSSAVMILPVSLAALIIASLSIGLMVCMFNTLTLDTQVFLTHKTLVALPRPCALLQ